MSYGYLIITKNGTCLLQDRYQKFDLTYQYDDLNFYTRLDETQTIIKKENNDFVLTQYGISLFEKIAKPTYFMYFLLENKQGEYDVSLLAQSNINKSNFKSLNISEEKLMVNQLYAII